MGSSNSRRARRRRRGKQKRYLLFFDIEAFHRNVFQIDYRSIERRALMYMIDEHRKVMTDLLMISPLPAMLVPRDSFPGLPDFIGDPHFKPTWELPKDVTVFDHPLLTKTQKLLSEQIDLYTQACITAGRILPLEQRPEASAHAIRSRDPSRET